MNCCILIQISQNDFLTVKLMLVYRRTYASLLHDDLTLRTRKSRDVGNPLGALFRGICQLTAIKLSPNVVNSRHIAVTGWGYWINFLRSLGLLNVFQGKFMRSVLCEDTVYMLSVVFLFERCLWNMNVMQQIKHIFPRERNLLDGEIENWNSTHWPLGNMAAIWNLKCVILQHILTISIFENIKLYCHRMSATRPRCLQMKATKPHRWLVNSGLSNGLVPSEYWIWLLTHAVTAVVVQIHHCSQIATWFTPDATHWCLPESPYSANAWKKNQKFTETGLPSAVLNVDVIYLEVCIIMATIHLLTPWWAYLSRCCWRILSFQSADSAL